MSYYSLDLRQKALQRWHDTQHKSNVCRTFNIARTTLDDWIALEKEIGHLTPKPVQRAHTHTISDWDDFKTFVGTTSFQTIYDLIQPFEQRYNQPLSYEI